MDDGTQDTSASGGAQAEIHRAANAYLRKMQLGTAHPQEAETADTQLAPVAQASMQGGLRAFPPAGGLPPSLHHSLPHHLTVAALDERIAATIHRCVQSAVQQSVAVAKAELLQEVPIALNLDARLSFWHM